MILNFGPLTVYRGGTPLDRKTFGGVSLNLETLPVNEISDDFDKKEILLGGTGTINFYWWPTVTFTNSLDLLDFEEVILTNPVITITLYKCRMKFNGSIESGMNKQKPVKVDLVFTANDAGNIIKIQ